MRAGITIGVPIYRGKFFVEESLASVRNQTYPEIEVIMSLDGPDPECEANRIMSQVQTEYWASPRARRRNLAQRLVQTDQREQCHLHAQGVVG